MLESLQLVTPFPREHYGLLWGWLNEDKEKNFSDDGPRTLEALKLNVAERQKEGETIYEVLLEGEPIGVIAHKPVVDGIMERFNGICFTEKTHGTGVPFEAVAMVLDRIFKTGVSMVAAAYFADNLRVEAFLKKLGFGYSTAGGSAWRNSKTVESRQSMVYVEDFMAVRGAKADAAGSK